LRRLGLLLLASLLLGAATPELTKLEQARDARPNDPTRRVDLAGGYYRQARLALDQKDYTSYETYLGKSMDEALEGARLDPRSPQPHFFMGVVAAYQGHIDSTLRSFANARKLEPRAWQAYTNIAETMVYKGTERREIERWIDRAEKLGADSAVVELDLCLVSWRDGDLEAAERHFERVKRLGPKTLEQWNEAPVPKPIVTFADLRAYCCGSPACGPYLANACKQAQLEVTAHDVPAEVARRELVIEMERRRKLNEIYQNRKDLEIQVEKPEEVPGAPPPKP